MTEIQTSPLHQILDQINRAAEAGLDLVAIGMAVALPHLCASLSKEDGRAQGEEYKDWCAQNLNNENFSYLTPDDLYSLRCGMLHQGRFGDLRHSVSRVIFTPAGPIAFSDNILNDAYFCSVDRFCKNLCDAAHEWYNKNLDDPIVMKNLKLMMQYYSDGLSPYVSGLPVIA